MFFRKKASVKKPEIELQFIPAEIKDYPAKIVLAWAKAIDGEEQFLFWLKENGYPELVMATYAIYLKDDARDWLMKNGFPHLMALINAAEGNKKAQSWLIANKLELYFYMAMAIEDEQMGWKWLKENAGIEIFLLTKSIKIIKDKIEENHNDIHSYGRDY